MARKRYVGPPQSDPADIGTVGYVTGIKNAGDISSDSVDTQINNAYSSYADKSYVDTRDALNANKTYIDAGDATRLKLTQKDANNGVPGLNSAGKVLPQKINLPSNQRLPRAFWSPASYNVSAVNTTSEATVYTCNVTDPGYPYKLHVFGQADIAILSATEWPIVNVRQGNETTGQIIASGNGLAETYPVSTGVTGGDNFNRVVNNDNDLGSDWNMFENSGGGAVRIDQTVYWIDGFNDGARSWQRIHPLDRYTNTNDQRIFVQTGDRIMQLPAPGVNPSEHRYYLRMNDARTQYVFLWQNGKDYGFGGNSGSGEFGMGSWNDSYVFTGSNMIIEFTAIGNVFTLYRNGEQIQQVVDTTNATVRGPNNRGWGFRMKAGNNFFGGQAKPADINAIRIEDADREFASAGVPITPHNPDTQTTITGPTTLYVRLLKSSGTASVEHTTFMPSLWVSAVPA